MAETLISTRLLEVISNRSAENGRSPGQPPFPDVQGHFRGHGHDAMSKPAIGARIGPPLVAPKMD
jgi:hypothetical protein